jgi:hypothetical protein
MSWDNDYLYTYKMHTEDKQPRGLQIDSALAVFVQITCQLHFLNMLFTISLKEFKEGQIDIIGAAYFKQERQDYACYSSVGFPFQNVVFVRKDKFTDVLLNNLSNMNKYRIKIGIQIAAY